MTNKAAEVSPEFGAVCAVEVDACVSPLLIDEEVLSRLDIIAA